MFINPFAFDNNFGPPGFDPLFANTVLLANFNGSDAATSYSDESAAAKGAFTFVDNAQLDTAQFQFGSSSLLLDGTGDRLTLGDDADWTPGAGEPYTWEAWVRPAASGGGMDIATHYHATSSQRSWQWVRNASDKLVFAGYSSGTTQAFVQTSDDSIAQDAWSHVAEARDADGNCRMFVNGIVQSEVDVYAGAFHNSTTELRIGNVESGGESQFWNGWIDSIRFTKGVARYTTSFFIPEAAFPLVGP